MATTRRAILGAALATAVVSAAGPLLAQQRMQTYLPPGVKPKPKGPLIFLDYDQEEIDYAYDQAPWAPNRDEIEKRNEQKSAAAIARLGPGDLFGEMALLVEQGVRSATVRCIEPLDVWSLPRRDLDLLAQGLPDVRRNLAQLRGERLPVTGTR